MTTPSPVYLVGIKLVGSGTLDFMLFHNRAIFSEKGVDMHWTGIYLELLCFNFKYRLFQLSIQRSYKFIDKNVYEIYKISLYEPFPNFL